MPKRNEMTIEGIKRIITRSGYLLEIDVADALRRDEWLVFSQYPYKDKEEKKTRLVDVLAMKYGTKDLGVSLLVECKKATRHGWAFSSIKKSEMDAQALVARLDYFFSKVGRIIDLTSGKVDIKGFHSADIKTKIGTSCCIPPNHPDDFHEAVLQLLSSMRGLRDRMRSQILFPVIVFDGPMWEFYKEEGNLQINKVEYLQYISAIFDEEMEGSVLIDVVRFSFLPQFLRLVNGSVEWLKKIPKVKTE